MDDQRAGRPVVVGVDSSGSALQAARWAAQEAARRRAPLRLVVATGRAMTAAHQYGDPTGGPDERQVLLRQARSHLAEAERAALEAVPGTRLEQEVLDGFPIPRLVDESRAAQLVVIGDHGLGGVTGLLLGSVAFALGAQGSSPSWSSAAGPTRPTGPSWSGSTEHPPAKPRWRSRSTPPRPGAHRCSPSACGGTCCSTPVTLPALDWDGLARREELAPAERLAGWQENYRTSRCSGWWPGITRRGCWSNSPSARSWSSWDRTAAAGAPGSSWARSATPCCTARAARW